jgi:hypothetical protein
MPRTFHRLLKSKHVEKDSDLKVENTRKNASNEGKKATNKAKQGATNQRQNFLEQTSQRREDGTKQISNRDVRYELQHSSNSSQDQLQTISSAQHHHRNRKCVVRTLRTSAKSLARSAASSSPSTVARISLTGFPTRPLHELVASPMIVVI